MYIVEVLIEYSINQLDRTFSYLSNEEILTGVRVVVSFNRKKLVGYVESVEYTSLSKTDLEKEHGFTYQMIEEVIDTKPLLNHELNEVADYLAKITLSPKIVCLSTMLPIKLKPNSQKGIGKKYERYVQAIYDNGMIKTKKQQECFEYLNNLHRPIKLNEVPYSVAIIKKLVEIGVVDLFDVEVYRNHYDYVEQKNMWPKLNTAQQKVVSGIMSQTDFKISLLYGVTGSGKTEVYLNVAKEVLEKGKNVMMLVPEIALTPMMVMRFKERFGPLVAVFHSKLSQGEKYDEYLRVINKEARIVVGARSAIFAPLEDIGMIIMDEEHDHSYKQDSSPRYHTRDIARFRAKYHRCPLILASATPSIETYARAKKQIYNLYELKTRFNTQSMPQCRIVDMSKEMKQGNYSIFSNLMKQQINLCLSKNEQVILLLNRRGYSNYISCKECGHVIKCPHCDVALTYHRHENELKCHYCNYHIKMVNDCPRCHSKYIMPIGYGTQKIEDEIYKTFKDAKVIRMDVDTTRQKNAHEKLLKAFENQEANILLGTQMISKGLDFENVTFVGVINADLTLNLPDFRANEKTFQLLCQVSGRSGRGKKVGNVVIQTYNPDHYAIVHASHHDYISFYNKEMEYRYLGNYPPFCRMVNVVIRSKDEKKVNQVAKTIAEFLKKHSHKAIVLGPSQALIYKVNDYYRMKMLIKYKDDHSVYEELKKLHEHYNKNSRDGIDMMIDFNPYQQV